MSNAIQVIQIKAGSASVKVVKNFNHTTENMQKAVGGWLEALPFGTSNNIVIWLNEEGKLANLEPTIAVLSKTGEVRDVIVGDIIITGARMHDTVGLTDAQVKFIKSKLNGVGTINGKKVIPFVWE